MLRMQTWKAMPTYSMQHWLGVLCWGCRADLKRRHPENKEVCENRVSKASCTSEEHNRQTLNTMLNLKSAQQKPYHHKKACMGELICTVIIRAHTTRDTTMRTSYIFSLNNGSMDGWLSSLFRSQVARAMHGAAIVEQNSNAYSVISILPCA